MSPARAYEAEYEQEESTRPWRATVDRRGTHEGEHAKEFRNESRPLKGNTSIIAEGVPAAFEGIFTNTKLLTPLTGQAEVIAFKRRSKE